MTRQEFWRDKIERNRRRDREVLDELMETQWRVQVVWECALRGNYRRPLNEVLDLCEAFVRNEGESFSEVTGYWLCTKGGDS